MADRAFRSGPAGVVLPGSAANAQGPSVDITVLGARHTVTANATFSPCGRYRYTLRRDLAPLHAGPRRLVAWLMLNPSTADATLNDPTIRRCIGFSAAWGFTDLVVVNAYAWRSTDPKGLWSPECNAAGGPVGAGNNAAIVNACARAELVVCGWGRHLRPDRREALAKLLAHANLRGKLTALATNDNGSPAHPLRLPSSLKPQPYALLTVEERRG